MPRPGWGAAAAYVSKSPKLREKLRVVPTTARIAYHKNNAYISALSADKDSAEGVNAHSGGGSIAGHHVAQSSDEGGQRLGSSEEARA